MGDGSEYITMIDDKSEPGSWKDALQWREKIRSQQMYLHPDNEQANAKQVGGDHYKNKTIQPWTAMEAWMTHSEFLGFLRGNVIKYVSRAGSKGDALEDYRKAQHYLDKLIEKLDQ